MVELKGAKKEEPVVSPIDRVVENWNGVIDGLVKTKGHWEAMQELLLSVSRSEIQSAPMEVQKALAKFKKAKFEVMLERFVAHYRAFGGLEAMRVKKGGVR